MTAEQLTDLYAAFHDDATYARESLTVADKHGVLMPMIYGPAQLKLAAQIQRIKARGKAVRIICGKARQVWITNGVASRFFRDTANTAGQHTLVLAHDSKSAKNIFTYYQRFEQNYRPFRGVFRLPALVSDVTDALEYENGSWIKIHTAGNVNIGRSFQLRRLHLSEFAFYGDTARAVMASAMGALTDDADTEAIIESSANGVGNEFHIIWQQAVAGESDWETFFFAWWEHPEYVRELDGDRAAFSRSLTEAERKQQQDYNLTLEQLNWRRATIRNKLSGDEDLFDQEYPHSPETMFIASGRPRFAHAAIARMPLIRDALEGGLELSDLSGRKKLIFLPRERGELVIYRQPQEHREYMIGADTSEGIDANGGKGKADPDYGVAQVLDRDTGEQVARLRARFTPGEFGRQLYMLGVYFYWAQQVLEANGVGLASIDSLLREGYPRHLLYHRIQTPDQDPPERSDLIGYKQTLVSRPQLISYLDESIRTLGVLVHDPVTISELRTFVIKASGRAEHIFGAHDDTVFALGLAVIGMLQMPRRARPKTGPGSRVTLNNYKKQSDDEDERGTLLRRF